MKEVATTTALPTAAFNRTGLAVDGVVLADQAEPFVLLGIVSDDYFRLLQIPLKQGRTFDERSPSSTRPRRRSSARAPHAASGRAATRSARAFDSGPTAARRSSKWSASSATCATTPLAPMRSRWCTCRRANAPCHRAVSDTGGRRSARAGERRRTRARRARRWSGVRSRDAAAEVAGEARRPAVADRADRRFRCAGTASLFRRRLCHVRQHGRGARRRVRRPHRARLGAGGRRAVGVAARRRLDRGRTRQRHARARLVARLLRDLLYGVSPFDPLALGAAIAMLTACAAVALLMPLRRAMLSSLRMCCGRSSPARPTPLQPHE